MKDDDDDPNVGPSFAIPWAPTKPWTIPKKMLVMEAKLDYFGQYEQSMVQYHVAANIVIMKMISRWAASLGLSVAQLPAILAFNPQPTPQVPKEQEEEDEKEDD